MVEATNPLVEEIRRVIVSAARLEIEPGEIGLDQPLHGPDSLALNSIDIFDMVAELEGKLGIQVPDEEIPRLNSVAAILAFVESRRNA
ncbi:MAG: acyl carrier protein [Vicinamibacteria bacterium]|nr:acyl carrier protein [Vicinamibacteria bacterium]